MRYVPPQGLRQDPLTIHVLALENTLTLEGAMNLSSYGFFSRQVAQVSETLDLKHPLSVDGAAVRLMDTSGAWALVKFKRQWEASGGTLCFKGFSEGFHVLIGYLDATVASASTPASTSSISAPEIKSAARSFFEAIGEKGLRIFSKMAGLTAFLGEMCWYFGKLFSPTYGLRWPSLVTHLERSGIHALPVVGLISFLIGIVLTFQGSDQLSRFGAQIYTVNLVGISILREIGILLTAIVVAGRSGSAFTAQIGSMKLNQEIDALQTMGLQPFALLVMPRVVALMLVMPLLAFFANVMGLLGGALMSYLLLNISFELFFYQLRQALTLWTFWIGMIKAPVFAFVIALVGCYEGFAVENRAESIGQHTTWSVVEGITFVIVADALFSILFTQLGI
jgi:phospholipid/cholesterol/gamma-HCH transport system permease protein